MKIDLLFVSHNRYAFTEASLDALIANTDWSLIGKVHFLDDESKDGTAKLVRDRASETGRPHNAISDRFGGPVACMNFALDRSDADVLAKIDNDVIVCPGWLNRMAEVLERFPPVDVLGMELGYAQFVGTRKTYSAQDARWVGGVGLFRTRVFQKSRPEPAARWFGWTEFQQEHCKAAWITPDLPVFLLDRLPFEPWSSLSREYFGRGWQRHWSPYGSHYNAYWDWWRSGLEVPA